MSYCLICTVQYFQAKPVENSKLYYSCKAEGALLYKIEINQLSKNSIGKYDVIPTEEIQHQQIYHNSSKITHTAILCIYGFSFSR